MKTMARFAGRLMDQLTDRAMFRLARPRGMTRFLGVIALVVLLLAALFPEPPAGCAAPATTQSLNPT